jgi:predicted metal-dependent HD superfamily phosphohydrolase
MNLQLLLEKWKIKMDVNLLLSMWNESQRYYHNLDHLNSLLSDIKKQYESNVSEKEFDKLNLVALFHDIVYDPTKVDNEEKSADFFMSVCQERNSKDILDIRQSILDTKTHNVTTNLSERFNKLDMSIVESDYDSLLRWEEGILEEYSFVGIESYKKGRISFLESLLDKYNHNAGNLLKLIDHVNKY